MKKLLLICSIFLLMGSVYAGEYSTVNVNGVDFEIPPQYSGGDVKSGKYVYDNLRTFAILCVDDYLVSNFGGWATISDYAEEITINDRPCMLLTVYNTYIKANISYLYFPVDESIYCICFRADNITPEISHIVESAPDYNISSDTFYGLLNEAYDKYKERQLIDASSDSYSYVVEINKHDNNRDDQFIKWFLLTQLR